MPVIRSLSESLKTETRDLHVQAERSPFMRVLLRGQLGRPAYCALLRNLHAIYEALEPALERHATDPRIAPLLLAGLPRVKALQEDLEAWCGAGWRESLVVQPAAARYIARIEELDRGRPELLIAHSYVRYLGDLSGGQMLARIVRDSLAPGSAPGPGTAFYDFGSEAEVDRMKQAYRERLDLLAVDAASAAAIVGEAKRAFEMHRELFEELAEHELPA
ncbi:MAG: biliverdin-producing heme oxygenase [Gammaproteobacteria bacterium]|nr:biliverdin-producing heme oxygenase [Gammaproteobacteria bacterium]MBU1441785.1 biliverdin-producing heme oxygenase [Gammaproteobacteria bacterium]MBU2407368.1 biliverdin-producing heme oxygenase [Gammaproteobacteria bacterium]